MDDERDDLIREYQNRPEMWEPTVAGFQDRGYLFAAKREIAKKFDWESGMYTYIHTPYIPSLVTTFLCKTCLYACMPCDRVCTNLSHHDIIFFVLLQRKPAWEKLKCTDTISSLPLGQCTKASHVGTTIYHSNSSFN